MSKKIFLLCVTLSLLLPKCYSLTDHEIKWLPIINEYVKYWNTGDFQNIEDILHSEFELRMTPKYESEKGIGTFKEHVTLGRTAYPDFHLTIKEIFFTEKEAAGIWEITATNTGKGSHPPTGKSVKITGMSILHFKEGKIKDEWIGSNNGYWLTQLGFKLKSPFEE